MRRVGWHVNAGHPAEVFDERGREQWRLIRSLLVHDGGLDGASILDFGCGVGRVLRHAVTENPEADHWGCDLRGRDDRYDDRSVFFEVDEGKFFELTCLLGNLSRVALYEGDQVRGLSFGVKVSGGYSRAFAWVVAPPSLRVRAGEVLWLQNVPAILFDGGAD